MTHVYHATQNINCTKKIRPHDHTDERSGCNKVTVHYNILILLQNIILKIADQKAHDIISKYYCSTISTLYRANKKMLTFLLDHEKPAVI